MKKIRARHLCISPPHLSSFCPKRRREKSSPKNPKEKKKRRERLSKKKTPFYANKIMVKLTMIARVLDGLPLAEGLDTDATLDLEYYKQQAKTLFKKLSSGAVPPSRMSYESGEYFMHYVIENGVCYLTLCDRNYPKKLAYSYLEGERINRIFAASLSRSRARGLRSICKTRKTPCVPPVSLRLLTTDVVVRAMFWFFNAKLCVHFVLTCSVLVSSQTELQREFADKHGATVDSVARPYAFIKFDTFIQKTKKLYSDQRTQRNLDKLNEDLHDIQSIMTRNINDVLEQGERLDRVENMSGNLAMESKKYAKKAKDLSRQALIQKYMPVIVLVGLFIFVYGFRRFFKAA